jgi:hypothetical protein
LTFTVDVCGDPALGAEWRRAYRSYVDECPFSAAARAEFLRSAEAAEREFGAKTMDTNTRPDHILDLDGRHTCKDVLTSKQMPELRRRLNAFAEGKLNASDALGLNCDGSDKH